MIQVTMNGLLFSNVLIDFTILSIAKYDLVYWDRNYSAKFKQIVGME